MNNKWNHNQSPFGTRWEQFGCPIELSDDDGSNPHSPSVVIPYVEYKSCPPPQRVGYGETVLMFAHQSKDEKGLIAEMLAQGIDNGTWILSAQAVVRNGRFHGQMVIEGDPANLRANIANALRNPLFQDPISRVEYLGADDVDTDTTIRREFAVTAAHDEDLIVLASVASLAQMNIAYCDIESRFAAHGVRVLDGMFHIDVPRWEEHLFDQFVNRIVQHDLDGLISLIAWSWDLD